MERGFPWTGLLIVFQIRFGPVFTNANWNMFQFSPRSIELFAVVLDQQFVATTSLFPVRNSAKPVESDLADAISSDDWHVLCERVIRPISSAFFKLVE